MKKSNVLGCLRMDIIASNISFGNNFAIKLGPWLMATRDKHVTANADNDPTEDQFKLLKEFLERNKHITILRLGYKKLGLKGMEYLSEILKVNNTITKISLSYQNICAEAIKPFSEMLKVNKSLAKINLSGNNIGTQGVEFFAESLKNNHTITKIRLNNIDLTPEGLKFLTEMIKVNSTIISLSLFDNTNCSKGGGELLEAVKVNNTLTSINLNLFYLEPKIRNEIEEALKVNKGALQEAKELFKMISIPKSPEKEIKLSEKAVPLFCKKLLKDLLPKLITMSSKELYSFYEEQKIDDKTFNSYKNYLIKAANDSDLIDGIFLQYKKITSCFVDILKHLKTYEFPSMNECFNQVLQRLQSLEGEGNKINTYDFGNKIKFYEALQNSPLNITLSLLKNCNEKQILEMLNGKVAIATMSNDEFIETKGEEVAYLVGKGLHDNYQQLFKLKEQFPVLEGLVSEIPVLNYEITIEASGTFEESEFIN